MKLIATLAAGATLAIAPAALAQTAPQTAPATPPAPAAPAAQAAPVTSATVTDAELTQFVTVALEIEKIRKDPAVPEADKSAKMATAAQSSGIDPVRFNAIGQAMSTDTALNARVQAMATKLASADTPAAKQP
ncbi:DUF4168 domain-containing protein [Sphingomonas sp. HITSZ_GF]|uniref:DUF4168 domain-containing protein n=1 Tax=Sphingomonas sp. HITSZ_GF TaxID=3037247 RepID=UPI00240D2504|nr:DUF4168 domain-containing protein [Sphingomonas sp. HITSZ_GF]MDG2533257.1 DUF4168 domain-containing protein [Sphingomonas sp. HITSZ_GF]